MKLENYQLEELKKEITDYTKDAKKEIVTYSKELLKDRERLIKYGIIAGAVVATIIIVKLVISAINKNKCCDFYDYDDFDDYDEYDDFEFVEDLEDDFVE